jgi:two-component system, OmpR family, phosphate regulon response regulator PhoB
VTRILIVEDEPAIAEVVALNLRHAGFEVEQAADAGQAHQVIAAQVPDLVLLDWMLPGQSGLSLARQWRTDARTRDLPIIMLTARADEADKIEGLEIVDDYLAKPFSMKELLARIGAVLRRKIPEAAGVPLEVAGLRLDPGTFQVSFRGRELKFGPTEFRLLRYLMAYPGRVHNRERLLDRVWGDQVYIEERTVDVHVKRLRENLAQVGCAGLIETVRGVGYRLLSSLPTTDSSADGE